MEGALFVLGLFALVAILLSPIAFALVLRQGSRIRELRLLVADLIREVATLRAEVTGRATELSSAPPPPPTPTPTPSTITRAVAGDESPDLGPVPIHPPKRDLETLIGGQWLTWVGILAIFFGTAFFLAYDLGSHALAGTGQVLAGVVVGAAFVVVGRVFSRRAQRFLGQGLLGGGIALLYLSAYAAHGFHDLISAPVVYVFLLVIAALGVGVALVHGSVAIAVLSLIGALLTPPLLETDTDPSLLLFPYLIAVSAGNALLATRKGWFILPPLAYLGAMLTAAWWWDAHYTLDRRAIATFGFTGLWLIYAIAPLMGTVSRRGWDVVRSVLVSVNGLVYLWMLSALMEPDLVDLRGLTGALLALVYVVGARLVGGRGASLVVSTTYYTGIVLAVVAVPIQFDAALTTLSWAALGAMLVFVGLERGSVGHRALGLLTLGLSLFRVIAFDTAIATGPHPRSSPFANADFLAGLAVVVVIAIMARLYSRRRDRLTSIERSLVPVLILSAATAFLWRLSAEVIGANRGLDIAAGTPGDRRLVTLLTLSLIWAVYAGALIAAGFVVRYRPIRLLGVAILGVLVLKVFILDMQALDRGYRVASFVGVGVLLLVISVLYQRERKK